MSIAKRRVLSVLMSVVMLLGMLPIAVLADDNPHAGHSSYIVHVEAADGNCTTPGNIEFWYCGFYTCEKYYSDAAMTQEISVSDAIITPGVHSESCVNCGHTTQEKTFELFTPTERPFYDEDTYRNNGLHMFTPQLYDFVFIFIGEDEDGNLYAMGNETNEDGSRKAVNISDKVNADGSVTADSDMVEFFTYKELPYTYTFSPDNGYMSIMDEKIVVHGQNIKDAEDGLEIPQSIRFEQNKEDLDDYTEDKGYFFAWNLNSGIIRFDTEGSEPRFAPVLTWTEENGETVDNRAHNIMLYMERCEHPNMTHTEAAEVSCTEPGVRMEYWHCEDCRMYYANAEGTEFIYPPAGENDFDSYLNIPAWGHSYDDNCICENCNEPCPHTNVFYEELGNTEPTCFEPGMGGFWYCDECYRFLDENKENAYWNERIAARKLATGHRFNEDTGKCDDCGIPNPVYSKVTSLDDVNEEDLYIIVAEADGQSFVLGGLDESDMDIEGNVWCGEYGNAICVEPNEDGTISLLNQDAVSKPSEFMFDINPDYFNSGLSEYGLTTVMPKLPNNCVYPFQSYSYDNNGYMGVPRYGNDEYGMWDSSDWIIDFYTTHKDENTYSDALFGMDGLTHAEQVENGNIDENVAEGNLLMYNSSFVAVGGAMFTLRLREYNGQYYFICGEDWALEGSGGWDYVTDTTPTNDTQYAIWLYRYDVPAEEEEHICKFDNWKENDDGKTHTGTCECGETETNPHTWDKGVETQKPTCTEPGEMTYTCEECGATQTDEIPISDHGWSDWISIGSTSHKKTCSACPETLVSDHRFGDGEIAKEATVAENGTMKYICLDCGAVKTEIIPKIVCEHSFGDWSADNDETHTQICVNGNGCKAYRTQAHKWDEGVVTTEPSEISEGVRTYTCLVCEHEKTEPVDMLEHRHAFGQWTSDGDETHTRRCENGNSCTAVETENHICEIWSDNNDGTHIGNCFVCGEEMSEEHEWSDWSVGTTENSLVRSCKCGAFEEITVQKPIEETVSNATNSENNGANAELVIENQIAIFNTILTEDEQTMVAAGNTTVSVYLEARDVPVHEVSSSDKAAAAAAIEEDVDLGESAAIGMYLDIDLFKEITKVDEGTSVTESAQISETSGKVTITIDVPEELINTSDSVDRIYRIIRVHEDANGNLITDVIEGMFDPENNTFTFETDKFSTYALAYSDLEIPSVIPGDVNADGKVDRKDLTRLAQYFARWDVEIDADASDANGDGSVDRKDLTRLAQYFARWEVELG